VVLFTASSEQPSSASLALRGVRRTARLERPRFSTGWWSRIASAGFRRRAYRSPRRYASRVIRTVFAALLLGAVVPGCIGRSHPSELDRCRRDPARYDSTRSGSFSKNLRDVYWGHLDPQSVADVTEERRGCAYRVLVRAAGRSYENGGFASVRDYRFNIQGDRLLYAASDGLKHWVVIDGVEGRRYGSIQATPRFSVNGRHVWYTAEDEGETVVVVDGEERARGRRLHPSIFGVLADGRALIAPPRPDGRWQVFAGRAAGPVFDDIVDGSLRTSFADAHYGYVGRRGADFHAVIDEREIEAPGRPARITFSVDEAHYAFTVSPIPGRSDTAHGVIVDGRFHPFDRDMEVDLYDGGLAVAHGYDDGVLYVPIGARTPSQPPTQDDYRPASDHNKGERVKIGQSMGPRFDEVRRGTLRVDVTGLVTYQGVRGTTTYDVVDNVIQEPSELPSPVQLQ
jgi:hypothetical protein